MALAPGTRLGPYAIEAAIGAGGMGDVYRARDTRLDRTVAIKVLSANLGDDPDLKRRFEREARAISSLNHPNICSLFDVGEQHGVDFLVMEYLEGHNLGDRLTTGPLPLREVLQLGIQITDALDYAHSRGVVHRDLKPGNVVVTSFGAKLVDFGLAKLAQAEVLVETEVLAVTRTAPITQHGSTLGTVAYMSPEQAKGEPLDGRSDLFSLGAMLYQLTTGHMPFDGKTNAVVFNNILTRQPLSPERLNPELPPGMSHVIMRLLEKDRDLRYQSAAELRAELKRIQRDYGSDWSGAAVSSTAPPTAAEKRPSSAAILLGEARQHKTLAAVITVAFVGLLISAGLGISALMRKTPGDFKVSRLTFSGNVGSGASISPDGRYLAFSVPEGGQEGLWIRQLSTDSQVRIVSPADGQLPGTMFSPDGELVYFLRTNSPGAPFVDLYVVPALGGEPRKLCSGLGSYASISADGKRLAFSRAADVGQVGDLAIGDTQGGPIETIWKKPADTGASFGGPSFSPDGRKLAFGIRLPGHDWQVAVLELASKRLTSVGTNEWDSVGRVQWLNDGSGVLLVAQKDRQSQIWYVGYPDGKARRITNDATNYDLATLSLRRDDKSVVGLAGSINAAIWSLRPGEAGEGQRLSQTAAGDGWNGLDYAPDGRIVYVSPASGSLEVWSASADFSNRRQLTHHGGTALFPKVSPDGRYIVYGRVHGQDLDMWRMEADGSNPRPLTATSGSVSFGRGVSPTTEEKIGAINDFVDFSPDSKWLYYTVINNQNLSVRRMSAEGGQSEPYSPPGMSALALSFSPDGKLMKLGAREQDIWADYIYPAGDFSKPLQKFTIPGPHILVNWTPDGRGLSYALDQQGVTNIWIQNLAGGKPRQITNFSTDRIAYYAWSPDGSRLAISRGIPLADAVMIENFR